MADFPTEEQHAAAVKAFLTSVGARPFDRDETPAVQDYTIVDVSRRVGGTARLGHSSGVRSVRVSLRFVARSVDNVRLLVDKATAIEDVVLVIGDHVSTGVRYESSQAPQQDDEGFYTALWVGTYSV